MNNLTCNRNVAIEYGVNAAMILYNISFLCNDHKSKGTDYHDGMYWCYESIEGFVNKLGYIGKHQVTTALKKLLDDGIIVKGNYNTQCSRLTWYAITDKGYSLINRPGDENNEHCDLDNTECDDSISQNQSYEDTKTCVTISQNCTSLSTKTELTEDTKRDDNKAQNGKSSIYHNNNHNTNHNNNHNIIHNSADARAEKDDETVDNPFGYDTGRRPKLNTVQAYAASELSPFSYRAQEELNSFIDDTSEDVVRHAIDNALDNGVRKWVYVKAILEEYVENHVKTVGDAKLVDEEHKKRRLESEKQGQSQPQPNAFGLDRRTNLIPKPIGGGIIV